ncbi:MAG: acyltransferase [Mediterranea sp.]|jgi:fucose 4-O-acetylase-like acetyltransferase|nr:acyltransferase [Mediterranea sp.]
MYHKIDNLRSQSLDLLRFPLAIVVLANHLIGNISSDVPDNMPDLYVYSLLENIQKAFFSGQSVPVYFFISGVVFFLGTDFNKKTFIQKLKNRTRSLLIPYIIWNLIGLVYLLWRISLNAETSLSVTLSEFSIARFFSAFWMFSSDPEVAGFYPADGPLWFIRDLIIVVCLAPIICFAIKKTKYYFIILLGIAWFILGLDHDNWIRLWQLAHAFFFFSWGAYISICKPDMIEYFRRFFKLSIFLYLTLGVLCLIFHDKPLFSYLKSCNIIVGLFFAYNLSAGLLKKNILKVSKFLSSSSFYIYVSHTFLIGGIRRVMTIIFNPQTGYDFVIVFFASLVCIVAILLITFYLLNKYCSFGLKILMGKK